MAFGRTTTYSSSERLVLRRSLAFMLRPRMTTRCSPSSARRTLTTARPSAPSELLHFRAQIDPREGRCPYWVSGQGTRGGRASRIPASETLSLKHAPSPRRIVGASSTVRRGGSQLPLSVRNVVQPPPEASFTLGRSQLVAKSSPVARGCTLT